MQYNYNKLWKILIDKNMSKKQLCELSGVSSATLVRMKNNYPVSLNVLAKLSEALKCNSAELYDMIQEEK